jgi:hypothetical protein
MGQDSSRAYNSRKERTDLRVDCDNIFITMAAVAKAGF